MAANLLQPTLPIMRVTWLGSAARVRVSGAGGPASLVKEADVNRPVRRRALTALAALSLVGSVVLATPAAADPNNNSIRKLTKAVTLKGLLRHSEAFQAIADANGDNRASGLPGYDASADYVATSCARRATR